MGTGKRVSVISAWANVGRVILASAISPRQNPTASLVVLRAHVRAFRDRVEPSM